MDLFILLSSLIFYCIYSPLSQATTSSSHAKKRRNLNTESILPNSTPLHDHHYRLGSTDMEAIESSYDAKEIGRFQLDSLVSNKLVDILDNPSNQELRFFFIRFPKDQEFKPEVFELLDHVLSPRIWMSLRYFVTERKVALQKHFTISQDAFLEYVIIEHITKTADNAARILSKQNYPSASECEKRPMVTTNIIGDAWGNRMRNTMGFLRK
jgi:hypothetical protein